MDNNLQFWRFKEYISFNEAVCLIIDKQPPDHEYDDYGQFLSELSIYINVLDKMISDFRSYLNLPLKYEWLNDDELFYYPFLTGRTLGIETIIEDINDGCCDESFITSSLMIKQLAIKKWVKLNNIQSEYFCAQSVEAKQNNNSECLEIKEPKKKDDLYKAMLFYIKEYEDKNNKTPTYAKLWEILQSSNLGDWGLKFCEDKIVKSTGNSVDYQAAEDRYYRYYPKKK